MALNKVEICGVDTSKLPLLKEEEKKELFVRIKQGDKEATAWGCDLTYDYVKINADYRS